MNQILGINFLFGSSEFISREDMRAKVLFSFENYKKGFWGEKIFVDFFLKLGQKRDIMKKSILLSFSNVIKKGLKSEEREEREFFLRFIENYIPVAIGEFEVFKKESLEYELRTIEDLLFIIRSSIETSEGDKIIEVITNCLKQNAESIESSYVLLYFLLEKIEKSKKSNEKKARMFLSLLNTVKDKDKTLLLNIPELLTLYRYNTEKSTILLPKYKGECLLSSNMENTGKIIDVISNKVLRLEYLIPTLTEKEIKQFKVLKYQYKLNECNQSILMTVKTDQLFERMLRTIPDYIFNRQLMLGNIILGKKIKEIFKKELKENKELFLNKIKTDIENSYLGVILKNDAKNTNKKIKKELIGILDELELSDLFQDYIIEEDLSITFQDICLRDKEWSILFKKHGRDELEKIITYLNKYRLEDLKKYDKDKEPYLKLNKDMLEEIELNFGV
jgi:hypothetical protein